MPEEAYPINDDGVWVEQRRSVEPGSPALFCDRDGIIIHDRHYIRHADDVVLVDGIVDILDVAERALIPIVVVTNQSGIGRGYFEWRAFAKVQARMMHILEMAGIRPAAVLACPHHPDASWPYRHPDPPMRKPNPGMLLMASTLLGIDAGASLMIGDKTDDMLAAAAARLKEGILIDSSDADATQSSDQFVVHRFSTVRAALPQVCHWIRPLGS